MATLQVRVDDAIKSEADHLFSSLGLSIPFFVRHGSMPLSLQQAIQDSRTGQNLYGPYVSAEEAVASMLADEDNVQHCERLSRVPYRTRLPLALPDFR